VLVPLSERSVGAISIAVLNMQFVFYFGVKDVRVYFMYDASTAYFVELKGVPGYGWKYN